MEWNEEARTPHCNTENVWMTTGVTVCPVACIDSSEVEFKPGEKTCVNVNVDKSPVQVERPGLYVVRFYARTSESSDREDDNAALDNILPVRVYADVGQTVVDDGEDNHTGHHAKHGTYPAAERYAANHARRNRIQLIHKAEVVGRRADTPGFQQTTEGIEHARQRIDNQQVQRNVYPRHLRRFCFRRWRRCFTEAGLVPQHHTKATAISA